MMKISRALAALGLVCAVGGANAALVNRGGGLIYDTDLNITWLQDWNYAQTSGYDADGYMTWSQANAWAASLSYGGANGWRLPSRDRCGAVSCNGEMHHLWYDELGNPGGSLNADQRNTGDFTRLISDFWSETEYAPGSTEAFYFTMLPGTYGIQTKNTVLRAMAVHDGDVLATPIPAAAWLMLSGIGVLGAAARRRKAVAVQS